MTVDDDLGDAAALLEGAHLALERISVSAADDYVLANAITDLDLAVTYAHTKSCNLINWKRAREK